MVSRETQEQCVSCSFVGLLSGFPPHELCGRRGPTFSFYNHVLDSQRCLPFVGGRGIMHLSWKPEKCYCCKGSLSCLLYLSFSFTCACVCVHVHECLITLAYALICMITATLGYILGLHRCKQGQNLCHDMADSTSVLSPNVTKQFSPQY